jgi:glycosyltransferase involved in cell wall biosynthesis
MLSPISDLVIRNNRRQISFEICGMESKTKKDTVSIVIRVRNAGMDLKRCLSEIKKQLIPEDTMLEFIIVDNESSDGSELIAKSFGAKVVGITKQEFSWGRALNRGIAKTTGEIVILLSADAYPANEKWLIEMLKPFEQDNVAAVYGRQIARKDAPVDERVRIEKKFKSEKQVYKFDSVNVSQSSQGMPVSNACAAIRKNLWQNLQYDEDIVAGEEGIWSYEILKRGYSIVYQPDAQVYHSHREGPLRMAWREWELLKKNTLLKGEQLKTACIIRWVAGFAKRRLKNCFWPNVPLAIRFEGLLRLPFEMLAFIAVSFSGANGSGGLRWLFWK